MYKRQGLTTTVANAVVEIRTELPVLVLLDHLMSIEKQHKRTRATKGKQAQQRTLDLDLLYIEDEEHAGNKLTLPHPRLGERDFVLVPMEDLMHDPVRFFTHAGVTVVPPEERVGHVIGDLGVLEWQE